MDGKKVKTCCNCTFEFFGCKNPERIGDSHILFCDRWKWDGSGEPPNSAQPTTDHTETWLDKMAGWAMQSLIAMTKACSDEEWTESRIMAELSRQSYSMAEAMLAEKLKREKKEVEG